MTRILGLDLSLGASGAAILGDDGRLAEAFLIKSKPSMTDMERYSYIAGAVVQLVYGEGVTMPGFADPDVDFVAIEAIFASRNLEVFRRLAELSAVVQYVLYRNQVPYKLYPVYFWRKLLFGVGSKITQKDQVRTAVSRRFSDQLPGVDIERFDENTLEAWCVAAAARKELVDGVVVAPARARKKVRA